MTLTPEEQFKQNLFQLGIYYRKIIDILDVMSSGYVLIEDEKLNFYYTHLTTLIETILNENGFKDLKDKEPERYESLFGIMEDLDIEWEFLRKDMMEFLGKIEKQRILSGVPSYKLSPELGEFIKNTDSAIQEHKNSVEKQSLQFIDGVKRGVKKIANEQKDIFNKEDLKENNDHKSKAIKKKVFISTDYGIYLNKNTKKPSYPIKGKKRPKIITNLKDGKKDANILCEILNYKTISQLSKEINEINVNFKKKLKLKHDLIIHLETGGYGFNKTKYDIAFT